MKRLTVTALAMLVLGMTACGIEGEQEPRPVEPPPGPYIHLTQSPPEDARSGTVPMVLYMTNDGVLVAVTRQSVQAVDLPELMDLLLAGPTEAEQADGIGSALPGASVISQVRRNERTAEVNLAAPLEDTGRSDAVVAIAQVVCTLDARSDVDGVVFLRDGEVAAVPRRDGALAKGPLTLADYNCPPP